MAFNDVMADKMAEADNEPDLEDVQDIEDNEDDVSSEDETDNDHVSKFSGDPDEEESSEDDDQEAHDDVQQQVEDGEVQKSGEQNKEGEDLYTIKVNGEETQVTFNELQKAYNSKSESARLAQEAQQVRKQSEALVQQLQNDPLSVLQDDRIMGQQKLRETVENWLVQQYQYENMSDEERQQLEEKQRLRQYEEQEQRRKEQEEQQRFEELTKQYQEDLDNKITDALETSDVPKSDYTVARVVHYLRQGLNEGVDLDPSDVMPWVEKDYQRDLQQMMSKRDPQKLVDMFGEEALDNIRKADATRKKKQTGNDMYDNYYIGKGGNKDNDDSSNEKSTFQDIFGGPSFQ